MVGQHFFVLIAGTLSLTAAVGPVTAEFKSEADPASASTDTINVVFWDAGNDPLLDFYGGCSMEWRVFVQGVTEESICASSSLYESSYWRRVCDVDDCASSAPNVGNRDVVRYRDTFVTRAECYREGGASEGIVIFDASTGLGGGAAIPTQNCGINYKCNVETGVGRSWVWFITGTFDGPTHAVHVAGVQSEDVMVSSCNVYFT